MARVELTSRKNAANIVMRPVWSQHDRGAWGDMALGRGRVANVTKDRKGNTVALFNMNRVIDTYVLIEIVFLVNINIGFLWIGIPKPHVRRFRFVQVFSYYSEKQYAFFINDNTCQRNRK